jgi:purine-binding chemotaxis protein CheW
MKMTQLMEDAAWIEQDTQKGKFLTFLLGKEMYAIEIKLVTEIISVQPITKLPELPPYIKGIVNLRGRIISVMDVRLRFKMEQAEYDQKTCIIIIEVRDTPVGLIVDSVSEVLSIDDENIVPPPETENGPEKRFIKAIGVFGEQVKLILDCEKLLNDKDAEAISKAI